MQLKVRRVFAGLCTGGETSVDKSPTKPQQVTGLAVDQQPGDPVLAVGDGVGVEALPCQAVKIRHASAAWSGT